MKVTKYVDQPVISLQITRADTENGPTIVLLIFFWNDNQKWLLITVKIITVAVISKRDQCTW